MFEPMQWSDDPDPGDPKRARIVAARMKLKERFIERVRATPALADEAPMGSGTANRHGMPRVPPGQHVTEKWPVLDLGVRPDIDRETWALTLYGACARPTTLSWSEFMELDQVEDTSDFHCVTQWSRLNIPWRGVRFHEIAALCEPHEDAEYAMCHGYDGYTTNVPLIEAMKDDVLLAHMADGQELSMEHGGPVRMITPQLYAWKGAKWIKAIEFMTQDRLGFWEERGYSTSAHPWRNDRYS